VPFDLGATARLTAQCRDPGGTLTTAATATVTVTLPDGTTTVPTAAETSGGSGTYQADYVTVTAGRHTVRWVFTVPAHAYTDSFDVREKAPPAILSLADARAHLTFDTTTRDDELRGWIESVTAAVEWFVGPVTARTVTEDHSVGRVETLALRQVPALTLTSLAPIRTSGTAYDVGDCDLDPATGVVRRLDGGTFLGPLRVSYTAGRRIIPANITAAARIILQHLWRLQYGAARGVGPSEDFSVTEPIPGLGYAIPNRAMQLLDPHRLPPGVA
jgi:hypothetical protein